MIVLVTGGAGYVGNSLVPLLNEQETIKKIIVYDNLSRGELNFFFGQGELTKVSFVKGDILDPYKLQQTLEDVDVVIHLAAFVSQPFNHHQNMSYEQVNRWGTLSLVRCLEKALKIKKLCYLSSASVYGFRDDIEISDEPSPGNAYSQSKLEGEKYISLLEDKIDTCVLRAGNIFGFNSCIGLEGVINVFFFDALVKNEIRFSEMVSKRGHLLMSIT